MALNPNRPHWILEWDEDKRKKNLKNHRIDFADVAEVIVGRTITKRDDRFDYGEERFLTLGLLRGTVVVVVHTETDTHFRVISVRKANRREQEVYYSQSG